MAAIAAMSLSAAAAGVLDTVRQAKTLRLAVRPDAPPFSYKDADGDPAGFMVDLCRAVATDLAAELNLPDLKVEFVPVTSETRFDVIAAGKADLLCEPTTETLSRRRQVDFSIPTFVDGASLLVKGEGPSSLAELAGKKVGVLAGTTTERSLRDTLAHGNISAEVVPAKSHDDGIKMLEDGGVAAYFADRAILAYLAGRAQDPSQFRLANDYLSLEPYALALPRGDEDFRLSVDRALSHIYRTGGIAAVFAKTFGTQMEPSEIIRTLYLVSALPD